MILAVDIGTTSMKGGLIDRKGSLHSYYNVKLIHAFSSRDSELWVTGLHKIIANLLGADIHNKNLSDHNIEAVAISGNGPTLIPLDNSGKPLAPALFWKDKLKINPIEGCFSFYLPKAAQFKQQYPELYQQTDLFLSPHEFLIYTLSGSPSGVSPHHDFDQFLWPEEEILRYKLDPEKFPPIFRIGEEIGKISPQSAAQTGLNEGIPLFSAGNDFLAALLGTDTTHPGRTCDRAGSSEGINRCCEKKTEASTLRPLPHVKEGLFNLSSILFSTGSLFEWYRNFTGQSHLSYQETLEGIDSVPFDQYRPWFFPKSKCFSQFEEGHFSDLSPNYSKWDLGKSILEAIGFAVLEGIEEIESHGHKIDQIRISGGQCKNDIWNQLKSDITGREILVPKIKDAELTGNACAAYTGLGVFSNLFEATQKMVKIDRHFSPNPELRDLYREKFAEYKSFRPNCPE